MKFSKTKGGIVVTISTKLNQLNHKAGQAKLKLPFANFEYIFNSVKETKQPNDREIFKVTT